MHTKSKLSSKTGDSIYIIKFMSDIKLLKFPPRNYDEYVKNENLSNLFGIGLEIESIRKGKQIDYRMINGQRKIDSKFSFK